MGSARLPASGRRGRCRASCRAFGVGGAELGVTLSGIKGGVSEGALDGPAAVVGVVFTLVGGGT